MRQLYKQILLFLVAAVFGYFVGSLIINCTHVRAAEPYVYGFLDGKFYDANQTLVYFCFMDGNCYDKDLNPVKVNYTPPQIDIPVQQPLEIPKTIGLPEILNPQYLSNVSISDITATSARVNITFAKEDILPTIIYSTTSDFKNPITQVIAYCGHSGQSTYITLNNRYLDSDTTYYLKVVATDHCNKGSSTTSPTFTFKTQINE